MKYYIYEQATGKLDKAIDNYSMFIGTGYAGMGAGKNDPAMQVLRMIGPLPRGWYDIGPAYDSPTKGPNCFNLVPDPTNEMFGRNSFRIHADSIEHPGQASEGCIVMNHTIRQLIKDNLAEYNRIQVV